MDGDFGKLAGDLGPVVFIIALVIKEYAQYLSKRLDARKLDQADKDQEAAELGKTKAESIAEGFERRAQQNGEAIAEHGKQMQLFILELAKEVRSAISSHDNAIAALKSEHELSSRTVRRELIGLRKEVEKLRDDERDWLRDRNKELEQLGRKALERNIEVSARAATIASETARA